MSENPAPPRHVRLACLQPQLAFDAPPENRRIICKMMSTLRDDFEPDIVVLPEVFEGRTDPADEASVRRYLATLAADHSTHVIGGSCSLVDDAGNSFNSCLVFDRRGEQVGRYDKRVLFASEARLRHQGESMGIFELGGIRVGVLICADMWHPELARAMIDRVDVLVVPVCSGVPTMAHAEYAREVWRAMALTRAMENGLVVAVSDWAPSCHESSHVVDGVQIRRTHYTSGATCIIDPSGRPDLERIVRQVVGDASGVVCADVDLSALQTYRSYRRRVGLLPGEGNADDSRVDQQDSPRWLADDVGPNEC